MKRKELINQNDVVYLLTIALLILVLFIQKCGGDSYVPPAPKIDTVIKYITIHDTVKGKTKYIKGETDTSWITNIKYVPDTNYPLLLKQYKALGDRHFKTNVYKTRFPIKYGSAQVTDSIFGNELINSSLELDVIFPEKTVTITKYEPAKRQLYLGLGAYGNKRTIIDGVYIGALYKDRRDRVFGANIGYDNGLQIGASSYWKIKF